MLFARLCADCRCSRASVSSGNAPIWIIQPPRVLAEAGLLCGTVSDADPVRIGPGVEVADAVWYVLTGPAWSAAGAVAAAPASAAMAAFCGVLAARTASVFTRMALMGAVEPGCG